VLVIHPEDVNKDAGLQLLKPPSGEQIPQVRPFKVIPQYRIRRSLGIQDHMQCLQRSIIHLPARTTPAQSDSMRTIGLFCAILNFAHKRPAPCWRSFVSPGVRIPE
jgi:hypothetical protein